MVIINIFRILAFILVSYNHETAYELYSIGCQLELAAKVKEAIEYYKGALTKDPKAVEIYLSLANAYYKIRAFDRGIQFANQGLLVAPANSKVYMTIATGYIGKGDLKTAVSFYEKTLQFARDSLEIYCAIATIYEGLGDLKMAIKTLEQIPEKQKNSEVYTKLGTIVGKTNDHLGAIAYYHKALSLDTLNVTAIIGIGTGFDLLGIKDSSIYYYEKALTVGATMEVSKRLVDLYCEQDQYEKLIKIARMILSHDYYDNGVRRNLGYALYKSGSLTEACNEFLIAAGIDSKDIYSKFYIARIYLEQGRYEEAQREIINALKIGPDFVELWIYLGFIAIDRKDFKTATWAFTEASYRDGDLAQIYYLLGVTKELSQAFSDAYFYYKKSLALNPKAVTTLEALGNLCDRINKKDEALKIFQKIIQLDTMHAPALNYVGYTYAERAENLDSALMMIDRALALDANNGYYLDSRGWVFYQLARYEEALVELKRASEIVNDPVILEHLGDVYMKLNQPLKAKEAYQQALELAPKNRILRKKYLKATQ